MFGKTNPFKWSSLETVPLQYFFTLPPDRPNNGASNILSILRSSYQAFVCDKLASYFVFIDLIYRRGTGGGGGLSPPSSLPPFWPPDSPRLIHLQWHIKLSMNLPIREADAAPPPPPLHPTIPSLLFLLLFFPISSLVRAVFIYCTFTRTSPLKPAAYTRYQPSRSPSTRLRSISLLVVTPSGLPPSPRTLSPSLSSLVETETLPI